MIEEDDSYNVDNALATVCNLVGTQHQSKNSVTIEKSLDSPIIEKSELLIDKKLPINLDIVIPMQNSEKNEDEGITWLTCAGQLKLLVNEVKECDLVLDKIKTEQFPNPVLFLINSIQKVRTIQSIADAFLKNASDILTQTVSNNSTDILYDQTEYNSLIDHDPGKREKIVTASQRHYLISLGPHQPKLTSYPRNKSINTNKQRQFSSRWYIEFPLLEYSIEKDSAYCFVCFLFPNGPDREFSDNAWVTEGVRVWHKMKSRGKNKPGKLSEHFSCSAHKAALRDYCNFMKTSCHIDVLFDQANREKSIQIQHKREYNKQVIKILMDTTRTLARQGLAFRGDGDDKNGNFIQIVELLSRHCNVIKTWLDNKSMRPYHVTYLGSRSQNEFIELLSSETRNRVIEEVKNAEIYSVLADTTPDITHQDRLAICVRYVNNNGNVKERLLEINECTNKTGFGIAKNIYDTLVRNELNPDFIAFQSYDFATKHGCNASVIILNLIGNLESLYVFFNASTKRYGILSKKLSEIEGSLQLCNLSKTRWTARAESVKAVWTSFEIILETLQEISSSNLYDRKTKSQSLALFKKITSFDFIVSIMFMKNVLYKLKALTEKLEAKELNIIDASNLIEGTIKSLENINKDSDGLDTIIDAALIFSRKIDLDPIADFNKQHHKRLIPKKIDSNPMTQSDFSLKLFYRKEFKQVLDTLINLTTEHLKITIETLKPLFNIFKMPFDNNNTCSLENVAGAVKLFPEMTNSAKIHDINAIHAEFEILLNQCDGENLNNIFEKSESSKSILPWANRICNLALTAPVTTASDERMFSKLKLIKNYLRSKMADQ
ncbi:hypothetical protein QTP88_028874 [Uroleucon formosanum]